MRSTCQNLVRARLLADVAAGKYDRKIQELVRRLAPLPPGYFLAGATRWKTLLAVIPGPAMMASVHVPLTSP